MLAVIFASNGVERLALSIVLQDIKLEFGLSDTQLGLMSGLAFALFYSIVGVPIARWADRGNRVAIISIATALWSAGVALCGLAANFLQLLLIRVGVAVGEAGCIPPAHSLIADYFARAERPRAVSQFMLGGPLSLLLGYFVAGWLNQTFGWRMTFVLLGLPGVILAAVAWLSLHEPRRHRSAAGPLSNANPAQGQPSLKVVCTTLWGNVSFRYILLSFAITAFFGNGIGKWLPAFFVRSFGLQTGELGTWLALVYGLGSLIGIFWGGELATRFAKNNESLQLKGMSLTFVFVGVISVFVYLATNHYVAFALMAISAVVSGTTHGPLFATIQTLVPERMRAVSVSLIFLFANLVGMGLGPLAAGALSDALRPLFGEESLRYTLLALCPGFLVGAWCLWRASRTVEVDIGAVKIDLHGSSMVATQAK